jgi:uroporphyrin-III C-methyltransferase
VEKETDSKGADNAAAEKGNPKPEVAPPTKPTAAVEPAGRPDKAESRPSGSAKPKAKPAAPAKERKRSGFKRFLFWLIFLAFLAAGGYVGWKYYGQDYVTSLADKYLPSRQGERNISAAQATTARPPAVTATESGVELETQDTTVQVSYPEPSPPPPAPSAEVLAELDSLAGRVDQLAARVEDNQLGLVSQQQRLRELSTTSREDWLLSEAEYLLRLANQRILTERQTRNALALMESADLILKDLDQPDLFAVRAALARDITQLRMAGVVDREGLYVKLDALISAIPNLNLPKVEVEAQTQPTAEAQTWYRKLAANAWAALVKMTGIVRVERVDVPLDPVLLPSELEMLQLNVRLALEQAQIALMREEQVIYEASLERARRYIEERFSESPAAAVFLVELDQLSAARVHQPLPRVSGTLKALQDYIHLWHNRYEPESPALQDNSGSAEDMAPDTKSDDGGEVQ